MADGSMKMAAMPCLTPAPTDILAARKASGLSQSQAAALVCATTRAWQHWESGSRPMSPRAWELFRLKVQAQSSSTKPAALRSKSTKA